ncbi:MAG TPA: hypothetical protein VFR37_10160 [Longimicrobium sp.]|nr:hypothetical protein [Longimicrobium sp.]
MIPATLAMNTVARANEEERKAAERTFWEAVWILIVLVVCALILLPLGRVRLAWELAQAIGLLWLGVMLTLWVLQQAQSLLRVVDDPPSDAYVLSNLFVSGAVLFTWTAHLALLIREFARGAPTWTAAVLYFIGLLASHTGFSSVAGFYGGTIYRTMNLFVALGGYVLFSIWPAAARVMGGWVP